MGDTLIVFSINDVLLANQEFLRTAYSANYTIEEIGSYAFAAWIDYTVTSKRYWYGVDFDPMDSIVEAIYDDLDIWILKGAVLEEQRYWYELIIPNVAHLAMCLFLTIVTYISKYQVSDLMVFNYVTANECDYVVSF